MLRVHSLGAGYRLKLRLEAVMEARQVLVLGLWLFEHVFHRSGGGRVVRSYMCGYGVAVDTGRLGDNANVTVLLKS